MGNPTPATCYPGRILGTSPQNDVDTMTEIAYVRVSCREPWNSGASTYPQNLLRTEWPEDRADTRAREVIPTERTDH